MQLELPVEQFQNLHLRFEFHHCSSKLTRVIPKVFGLGVLDNNILHNLYISETYILYEL